MGDWPPNNNSVKMQNAVRDMVDACNDAGSISLDDDAVKRGSYILAYSKTVVKKVCEKASPRKLDGKDILVVNASHWMSEIGARLSPDCDVAMIWYYDHNDRVIKVSLRSFHDTVDVTEVAKKFGGGGHKKASGFTLPGDANVDDIFDDVRQKKERNAKRQSRSTRKKSTTNSGSGSTS